MTKNVRQNTNHKRLNIANSFHTTTHLRWPRVLRKSKQFLYDTRRVTHAVRYHKNVDI